MKLPPERARKSWACSAVTIRLSMALREISKRDLRIAPAKDGPDDGWPGALQMRQRGQQRRGHGLLRAPGRQLKDDRVAGTPGRIAFAPVGG